MSVPFYQNHYKDTEKILRIVYFRYKISVFVLPRLNTNTQKHKNCQCVDDFYVNFVN